MSNSKLAGITAQMRIAKPAKETNKTPKQ